MILPVVATFACLDKFFGDKFVVRHGVTGLARCRIRAAILEVHPRVWLGFLLSTSRQLGGYLRGFPPAPACGRERAVEEND